VHTPSPKGGQPRKPDRLCLTGILFVLKTGIQLRTRFDKRDDEHEAFMTLGCAMICWRRLHSLTGYF
jgi:hypothetical protein